MSPACSQLGLCQDAEDASILRKAHGDRPVRRFCPETRRTEGPHWAHMEEEGAPRHNRETKAWACGTRLTPFAPSSSWATLLPPQESSFWS